MVLSVSWADSVASAATIRRRLWLMQRSKSQGLPTIQGELQMKSQSVCLFVSYFIIRNHTVDFSVFTNQCYSSGTINVADFACPLRIVQARKSGSSTLCNP